MNLAFRRATELDLPSLIKLLAEDKLGKLREDTSSPMNQKYIEAFKAIDNDANNELIVALVNAAEVDEAEVDETLVGMLQITFIPYLTHIGSRRCLIEGVRVSEAFRGKGLGTRLFQWAIQRAKEMNCDIVQLTSNKQRPDAIRFYESLGFAATHEGFKMNLKDKE